ncbi:hypothetical protein [Pandoraea terrigena]|nr:hypothetical protein [Pandoraea terrigena]
MLPADADGVQFFDITHLEIVVCPYFETIIPQTETSPLSVKTPSFLGFPGISRRYWANDPRLPSPNRDNPMTFRRTAPAAARRKVAQEMPEYFPIKDLVDEGTVIA